MVLFTLPLPGILEMGVLVLFNFKDMSSHISIFNMSAANLIQKSI